MDTSSLDFLHNLLREPNTVLCLMMGARHPHVLEYIPVTVLRAPRLWLARYGLERSLIYSGQQRKAQ